MKGGIEVGSRVRIATATCMLASGLLIGGVGGALAVADPPSGSERSNVSGSATATRAGYADYLRDAGIAQVAALAAPGLAGMLVVTGAGGLLGYRQAKAGRAVGTGVAARFVNDKKLPA